MTAYLIVYGVDPADRLAAYKFARRSEAGSARLTPTVPTDGFGRHQPDRDPAKIRDGVGGCSYIVENEEDALTLNSATLLAIVNGFTGGSLKKFESRIQGAKRLLSVLPTVAQCGRCNSQQLEDQMPKQYTLGEFRPIRPSSVLGGIAQHVVSNSATAAQIGAAVDLNADTVMSTLKSARRSHGVDHTVAEDGTITLVVPEGAQLFTEKKEKPVKTNGSAERTRYAEDATIHLLVDKNPKRPNTAAHELFELYQEGQTVAQFLATGGSRAALSWDRSHGFIEIAAV